jgi:hypothetical protein
MEITKHFLLKKKDGGPATRLLDYLIGTKDPRICFNNTALNTVTKDELLGGHSSVYEIRKLSNGAWMEIEYIVARIENQSFDREAFVQQDERTFNLSHTPLQ